MINSRSKPSTIKCRICGCSIEWVKMGGAITGWQYRAFNKKTGKLHWGCGVKVKVYTKKEREAFAKERGILQDAKSQ